MDERFQCAIARFDEANSKDPNIEQAGERPVPRELLYAERLTEWVLRLNPNAPEALRLAARCQHICRWEIPRSDFPEGKAGYHRWRNELKRFHADLAGKILRECGYGEEMVGQVRRLNLKEGFPADPEARNLEDALCLVFLEFQLDELAEKTERGKVVNALRKSWAKMTVQAQKAALTLALSDLGKGLIEEALRLPFEAKSSSAGEKSSSRGSGEP